MSPIREWPNPDHNLSYEEDVWRIVERIEEAKRTKGLWRFGASGHSVEEEKLFRYRLHLDEFDVKLEE
jgi:hypothetical protein